MRKVSLKKRLEMAEECERIEGMRVRPADCVDGMLSCGCSSLDNCYYDHNWRCPFHVEEVPFVPDSVSERLDKLYPPSVNIQPKPAEKRCIQLSLFGFVSSTGKEYEYIDNDRSIYDCK